MEVAASVLALSPAVVAQAGEMRGSTSSSGVLELQAVARQTREPIAGAKLDIRIDSQTREDVTDEQGRCRIEYGSQPDYLSVRASKQGLVPVQIAWRSRESPIKIPADYTLAMDPGTSIGGILQDEQGKPIAGAVVHLLVPSGGDNDIERVSIWDHPEKTDAEGRWRCDIVPAQLNEVAIRLEHPDYISDEMYGASARPSVESLRTLTGVVVMKKGVVVAGRVLDTDGRPIEGATVSQGSDRFGTSYPSTRTDKDGRFEFKNAKLEQMILTVQARGYSPDLEQVLPQKEMPPVEFRLEPGHTLRGRIVDRAGNPVAGAFVAADTWRGHRSLEWRVDTDAEGRFRWDDAPADEILIDMGKQRYMSIRHYGMTAAEQEHTITMLPLLRIKGRAIDEETGQTIPTFTVCPGVDWGDGRAIYWERRQKKSYTDGVYEVAFSEPRSAHYVLVEAEGYLPGVSRPFEDGEGEVTYDLALKKGAGVSGTIRFADGQPVIGAEVVLCTPSQGVYIRNGRIQQRLDNVSVRTGQDGRFAFAAQTDAYCLVVLHDKGCAEVTEDDLAASPDVTLQPWGRVEGKVLIGSKPGADEEIRVIFVRPYDQGAPRVQFDCSSVADKEGRFGFDRVPAGDARVCRMVGRMFSHGVPVEVKAGETTNVTIGGVGRPVIGKVAIADAVKDRIDWQNLDCLVRSQSAKGFRQTLGMTVAPDGTFRIDDVPAGDYSLSFTAYAPAATPRSLRGERLGALNHSFSVPEMPGGRSDEPLDLGVLDLLTLGGPAAGPILTGKAVPDLKELQLGVSLEELNGKRLVLCFFDMNQRPSRNTVAQLARQAEALKAKGIAAVAVQTSQTDETALKEWVRQNAVGLAVGVIASGESKARSAWGVRSLPWLILADKDHVVRAEGFQLDELDGVLAQAAERQK